MELFVVLLIPFRHHHHPIEIEIETIDDTEAAAAIGVTLSQPPLSPLLRPHLFSLPSVAKSVCGFPIGNKDIYRIGEME